MAKGKRVGVHGNDQETGRNSGGGAQKTECPVSRDQFSEKAKPMLITITGGNIPEGESIKLVANVIRNKKTGEVGFSTGSLGWNANDKIIVSIDGVPTKVQAGLTFTVIGSKDEDYAYTKGDE